MSGQPLAHVVGKDGPAVLVSGRVAAWLLERTNLAAVRQRVRGDDRAIDEALTMLTVAGLGYQVRAEACASATTSPAASATASAAEVETGWITTEDAAARLGITPRAVRLAITAGRIPARREGRRWLVDPSRATAQSREQRRTA